MGLLDPIELSTSQPAPDFPGILSIIEKKVNVSFSWGRGCHKDKALLSLILKYL